jgi:hypothetical protein
LTESSPNPARPTPAEGGNDTARQQEQQLRAFFREKLLVAAEQCRKRGASLVPDVTNAPSCYVAYPTDAPELVEGSACINEEALRQMWEKESLPELAELAASLLEMRVSLRPAPDENTGDVSPFIYAMF